MTQAQTVPLTLTPTFTSEPQTKYFLFHNLVFTVPSKFIFKGRKDRFFLHCFPFKLRIYI